MASTSRQCIRALVFATILPALRLVLGNPSTCSSFVEEAPAAAAAAALIQKASRSEHRAFAQRQDPVEEEKEAAEHKVVKVTEHMMSADMKAMEAEESERRAEASRNNEHSMLKRQHASQRAHTELANAVKAFDAKLATARLRADMATKAREKAEQVSEEKAAAAAMARQAVADNQVQLDAITAKRIEIVQNLQEKEVGIVNETIRFNNDTRAEIEQEREAQIASKRVQADFAKANQAWTIAAEHAQEQAQTAAEAASEIEAQKLEVLKQRRAQEQAAGEKAQAPGDVSNVIDVEKETSEHLVNDLTDAQTLEADNSAAHGVVDNWNHLRPSTRATNMKRGDEDAPDDVHEQESGIGRMEGAEGATGKKEKDQLAAKVDEMHVNPEARKEDVIKSLSDKAEAEGELQEIEEAKNATEETQKATRKKMAAEAMAKTGAP